jgi:hypothetical protein
MDMTFDKYIEVKDLKSLVNKEYSRTIKWWCWKYDFNMKKPATSTTTIEYDNEGELPTYGFICLDDENVISVVDLIKFHNRNIKIQKIIE